MPYIPLDEAPGGGIKLEESGGKYVASLNPTDLAEVTTLAGTDLVQVYVGGVPKVITLTNLALALGLEV